MDIRFIRRDEQGVLLDSINKDWSKNHIYVREPRVMEHLVYNTPYREQFAGENNYSFVGMWDNSKLVGYWGAIPQRFNVLGEEVPSLTGTIWYANKNTGKVVNGLDIIDFAMEQCPNASALIGIGASDIAYKIWRLRGAYMFKDFPRWVCIVKKDEAVKSLIENPIDMDFLPTAQVKAIESDLEVRVDFFEDEKWDEYYKNVFAKQYIGTKRNAEFLRWRYIEAPILKYHFLSVLGKDGKYKGLAVVRIEEISEEKFIGRILEFISFDIEASILLANYILGYDNVIMWDFYCMSDITVYGLERAGFRKIPIWSDNLLMPTRFHPIDRDMLQIKGFIYCDDRIRKVTNRMSNIPWYVTRGDADQDRAN